MNHNNIIWHNGIMYIPIQNNQHPILPHNFHGFPQIINHGITYVPFINKKLSLTF